tara:strand:+ start:901 stop:1632 length:732 start_codon:yes stop_codon:yes gene_type:complete
MTFLINNVIIAALITMCAANLDLEVYEPQDSGDANLDLGVYEPPKGVLQDRFIKGYCYDINNCHDIRSKNVKLKSCFNDEYCDISSLPEHDSCHPPGRLIQFKWGDGNLFCETLNVTNPYCNLLPKAFWFATLLSENIFPREYLIEYDKNEYSFNMVKSMSYFKNDDGVLNKAFDFSAQSLFIVNNEKTCDLILIIKAKSTPNFDEYFNRKIIYHQKLKTTRRHIYRVMSFLLPFVLFSMFFK